MEIGQWVIIKNFSQVMDGREGEIIGKKLNYAFGVPYAAWIVKMDYTESTYEFPEDKLIATWPREKADFSGPIDAALATNDKDWFE